MPKLILEVIEAQSIANGTEYSIIPPGDSDYITVVGTDDSPEKETNAVVIPKSEAEVGPKHMIVQYKKETRSYQIKDNGFESGTFLRIGKPIEIKQGYIFAFGQSSMAIMAIDSAKLALKFITGSREDEVL